MDRGQNSGAGLKRIILAPSYHQNSGDEVKYCSVMERETYISTNQQLPLHPNKQKRKKKQPPNLDRGGLQDTHKTKSKMKNY